MTPIKLAAQIESAIRRKDDRIFIESMFTLPGDRLNIHFTLKTGDRRFQIGRIFQIEGAIAERHAIEVVDEFFAKFAQETRA